MEDTFGGLSEATAHHCASWGLYNLMVTSHLSIYKTIKTAAFPKHLISLPHQIIWCLVSNTAQEGLERDIKEKSVVLLGSNS